MRGLRFLLAATAASVTGDGLLVAATPLAAAALSPDPADIGIVAAASTAAWLVFGVPAGALVDRWDLRRTMIVSDLVRFLALAALGLLLAAGRGSIWALSVAVFVVGIATCLFTPAGVTLLRDIVGSSPTDLAVANGRFWSIDALGRSLAGPPLGAFAFGVSRSLPFFVDALSFGVSALLLAFTPASRRPPPPGRLDLSAGVRFLLRDRQLRALAASAWSFNFAYAMVFAPFVLYAASRLGLGALGFGLLLACGAAGSIVAGLLVPRLLATRPALAVYSGVFAAQAVVWAVILLIPQPVVAGVALAVLGAAATVGTVAGQATRQLTTPVALLGRVAAVHRIASSGGGTLGALAGGFLTAAFGANAPFLVAVAFLAPCALLSARSARRTAPPPPAPPAPLTA